MKRLNSDERLKNNQFELIFNIDAGEKYFFRKLELNIPASYDKENFIPFFVYLLIV